MSQTNSAETPTPRTAAAMRRMQEWTARHHEADLRGSHHDSHDPEPDDGWATAKKLEHVLIAVENDLEKARAKLTAALAERDAAQKRFEAVATISAERGLTVSELEDRLTALLAHADALAEALEFIRDECDWKEGGAHGGFEAGDNRIGPACTNALQRWRKENVGKDGNR